MNPFHAGIFVGLFLGSCLTALIYEALVRLWARKDGAR